MLNLRHFILSSFISKNVVMQRIIRSFCLVVFLFGSKIIYAQQPALGCDDKAMRIQSQQLKHDFASQGLSVYKDAMISMESHQPFPVAVQLDKGKLYQLIFIGSRDAKKISMELFDGSDKKIDERVIKNPKEQNFVVYSFTPEKNRYVSPCIYTDQGEQKHVWKFQHHAVRRRGRSANTTSYTCKH